MECARIKLFFNARGAQYTSDNLAVAHNCSLYERGVVLWCPRNRMHAGVRLNIVSVFFNSKVADNQSDCVFFKKFSDR